MHKKIKRILITTTTLPRWENDSEAPFVLNMARELNKYFSVTILAPHAPNSKKMERLKGIEIIRFPYWFEKKQTLCYGEGMLPNYKKSKINKFQTITLCVAEYKAIHRLIRKKKIDLIIAWWAIPQGAIAGQIKHETKIPYILVTPGTDIHGIKNKFFNSLIDYALKYADRRVVLSSYSKERIKELGYDSEVIPLGINLGIVKKRRPKNIRFTILCVGRLTEQKGFQYVIKSLRYIKRNVTLNIIGEGDYIKELEQIAKEENVENKVKFLGPKSNDQLIKYYLHTKVFIMPSIGFEALGLVAIEAMRLGVPVIASEIGGIPDIVKNNETGLLVPERDPKAIAEKVNLLFDDILLSKHLSKKGKEHIKDNFVWREIGKKWKTTVEGII